MKKILTFLFAAFLLITFQSSARAASVTVGAEDDPPLFTGANCSLRNAIQSANDNAVTGGCVATGGGAIDTVILPEGNYLLTIPRSPISALNETGDLDIIVNLTLQGAGSGTTIIQASDVIDDRVMEITTEEFDQDINVSISGVTITGGDTRPIMDAGQDGGGIEGTSSPNGIPSISLNDVILRQNITGDDGGGIQTPGDLSLVNCQVLNNMADDQGAGIRINTDAVVNLSIASTLIQGNEAGGEGGGISFFTFGGRLTISQSTIDLNTAAGEGGGINFQTGEGLITNSTISNNTVNPEQLDGIKFGNFSPGGLGGGIAFYDNAEVLIMVNSTISGNTANERGGGIFAEGGVVRAVSEVPAIKFGGNGGPRFFGVNLFNVTITDNEALGPGGGIYIAIPDVLFGTNGPIITSVNMTNTILAQNTAAEGPDCEGTLGSAGYNILGSDSFCSLVPIIPEAIGDKINVNPNLGPLQDNGGPTQTHGLMPDSQAIDMGNNVEGCVTPQSLDDTTFVPLNEDQRGFTRPVAILDPNNPICDIGAFEFANFDFEVTKTTDVSGSVRTGDSFNYLITITNEGPSSAVDVTLSDPVPSAFSVNSVQSPDGDCSNAGNNVTCTFAEIDVDQTVTVTINVTVVATQAGTITNVVTVTSSGNGFQETITKEAQVNTQVVAGGNLVSVFGGGCGFRLVQGPAGNMIAWFAIWAGPLAWGLKRRFRRN